MSKLKYNLSAAVIANQYVKSKMTIGASNKLRVDFPVAWACSGSAINTGAMREQVDLDVAAALPGIKPKNKLQLTYQLQRIILEKSAARAEQFGCGNCGEQSAIAFVYLRRQKTFPLDWMEVNDFEHGFVIIGRKRGSDTTDYRTWGDEAVICDPWRDVVATVRSEASYFATRKPNWIYAEIG
ncbi:MAG TPA: hypothetical protein VF692_14105 [Pyrinomonadaceae bacterium]|jgi:hypothetical protein